MTGPLLQCDHWDRQECRSCSWIERPYDDQLAAKQQLTRQQLRAALGERPEPEWLPPVPSAPAGFRTKAKMVVGGTAEAPTLGLWTQQQGYVDIRDCALHTPAIRAALPVLADFVTRAGLTPYDVPTRSGELKHALVTESPAGELMVRWVLRSTEAESRIRKHLAALLEELPTLRVVTLNVQPAHAAVIEGERELVLTEQATLPMEVNGLTLHLGPRSFFQTNTEVAAALYRTATAWVDEVAPTTVHDLYCGVGGFALHLAAPGRTVTGIEISAEAIAAADRGRIDAGLSVDQVRFVAGDATAALLDDRPDLVVVNPPRRGLGPDLAARLEDAGPPTVLYSSCNPETLARDLAVLRSYVPVRAQVLDMFPQTSHLEVLVLLSRRGPQRSE
ncbi:23S rRNA (uracil(747)-C(5))-methyltransferase RlmC [Nocardioides humilatus]|uniref:23S rRNA (Uracil(747)-C(5))-methyltransferase RlmC n=1 Tax=Nocardioides humilatus TaxID=2607660 RepID=A0A5B1LDX8_9ACTN|nr:23S rRNA (uracil(747)-C(5))-methyltransferase RlmC [Nocardioides humilatus]KAA1418933.1 23S rRNA (uracil(747)-C(5))-methyltransferase RlmC [Nocardioides humilatus]